MTAGLAAGACAKSPPVPPEGLPLLSRAVEAAPAQTETALNGCVRLHHVWKAEVSAVHRTAGKPVNERLQMLRDSAYTPYAAFWDGYVGGGFVSWARRHLDLAGDARSLVPTQVNLLDMIAGATARAAQLTGRWGCAEWYLVYGPGWADLGGLGDGRMLIDFFGLPVAGAVESIRRTLPHEVAHLIRRRARQDSGPDPDGGTVLASMIEEGVATYVARVYWGEHMTAAGALGYSDAEWGWALAHEADLWRLAASQLHETKPGVVNTYRMAREHLIPEGPGKAGYFLGYRIAEAYVAKGGRGSLDALFTLPVRQVLEGSGYAP